jgi:hypothetical protein
MCDPGPSWLQVGTSADASLLAAKDRAKQIRHTGSANAKPVIIGALHGAAAPPIHTLEPQNINCRLDSGKDLVQGRLAVGLRLEALKSIDAVILAVVLALVFKSPLANSFSKTVGLWKARV